jgi:hypothetical protein
MNRLIALPLAALLSSGVLADRTPRGAVRLEGRAIADDGGPFNALGTTLFWALWAEQHDQQRLDENLAWLSSRGVDYVRVLGMVGGSSWRDRAIDPASPGYWPAVDRLLTRLAAHALRAQVTLFAEADDVMPSRAARELFVDQWAAKANEQPERFVMLEIANEHAQNGLADVAELRALGGRLAHKTTVLVALSSPGLGRECDVYAGAGADVATIHYAREVAGQGLWAPVWQPWSWPHGFDANCRGQLPTAINNEPIGPQSSVAADDDPRRLTMAYIMTFMAGNAAYVLHTGAGVRGGGEGDRARGRPANIFQVARLDQTVAAIAIARRYLPPGLANWNRLEPLSEHFPFDGVERAVADKRLSGAYATAHENRFVAALLGVRQPIALVAREPLAFEVREVLSGSVIARERIDSGETFSLNGGAAAYVLIGDSAPATDRN